MDNKTTATELVLKEQNRDKIVSILMKVKRPGILELIDYIKTTDFFTAPASTKYHNNYPGGLAQHSLNVHHLLYEKHGLFGLKSPVESISICGLLHDICKTNFYIKDFKWVKDTNNQWMKEECWKVDDKFPAGHGEKSVFILQKFIQLTDEEIMTIRFHMGSFESGTHFDYTGYSFRNALKIYPLLAAMISADFEATYLIDVQNKPPLDKSLKM